jgi:eukaryotic translation initiation factor 2C
VVPQLITVPGRVLNGPTVKYKANKTAKPAFGSWNMISIQFSMSAQLPTWTYLLLSLEGRPNAWNSEQELNATMNAFQAKLKEVGIAVAGFTRGLKITLKGPDFEKQIDETLKRCADHPAGKFKLLLVILPNDNASTYNAVKRGCDINHGINNVCVVASKFSKPNNHQYFANVALKFNLKLGGQNQILDNSKLGIIAQGKTMVVGIDVTHPSPGSASNTPSVAGVVASIDQNLGQWPADLQVQTARQEMVQDLDGMLKSRLVLWAKKNQGRYPENILIYRDGVSEGQYNLVLDKELPLLRKACVDTYPASSTKQGLPRISIVVVGKRHHTRFYPTKEGDADRYSNPQNGTVVDRGVTEARNWDFYLQAHSAIKGTARPAHYYVVLDEIFRYMKPTPPFRNAAETLEDLTHNLCYLFGRATKAVSICPPAYYADLVCERARRYMSRYFDASSDASTTGSMAGRAGPEGSPDSGAVRLHPDVKDTMFYI